mmetsp:Transcript_126688/g.370168  ORF Transcript_126688/g.370168 Transcript_126688/m.370168 type:complete len:444 (+) Transcript_126688:1090-2421(+)
MRIEPVDEVIIGPMGKLRPLLCCGVIPLLPRLVELAGLLDPLFVVHVDPLPGLLQGLLLLLQLLHALLELLLLVPRAVLLPRLPQREAGQGPRALQRVLQGGAARHQAVLHAGERAGARDGGRGRQAQAVAGGARPPRHAALAPRAVLEAPYPALVALALLRVVEDGVPDVAEAGAQQQLLLVGLGPPLVLLLELTPALDGLAVALVRLQRGLVHLLVLPAVELRRGAALRPARRRRRLARGAARARQGLGLALLLGVVGLPGALLLALVLPEDLLLLRAPLLRGEGPAPALVEALALALCTAELRGLEVLGGLRLELLVLLQHLFSPLVELPEPLLPPQHLFSDDARTVLLLRRAAGLQQGRRPVGTAVPLEPWAMVPWRARHAVGHCEEVVLPLLRELRIDAVGHALLRLQVGLGRLRPRKALLFFSLHVLICEDPLISTC